MPDDSDDDWIDKSANCITYGLLMVVGGLAWAFSHDAGITLASFGMFIIAAGIALVIKKVWFSEDEKP